MIRFERIKNCKHTLYTYGENVLIDSFPRNEYRNIDEIKEYINSNKLFHFNIILKGNIPIGILTYWTLNECCYIEHFAIESEKRNNGYGKSVLDELKKIIQGRIVLEVEMPLNKIGSRRINFYEREGFKLYKMPYFQPPYRKEDNCLPMMIMAHGKEINDELFTRIRNSIYQEVYRYKLMK